jgi:predicted metal-binding membrane protein
MVLLFTAIRRKQAASASPLADAWIFLGGYLLVWTGFSLAATLARWALECAGLLSMAMASTSALLGGAILLLAGFYQFTPVKNVCLRYCQSPVLFLSRYWRPGATGALRMGLRHGGYCLGCCWFLMALLFVGGVMNVLWIAAISAFVLIEKIVPAGRLISRIAGLGFIAAGLWFLAASPYFDAGQ